MVPESGANLTNISICCWNSFRGNVFGCCPCNW